MLGLENPIHIVFLLVLVLLIFGAKRLPEMGKSLGEGLRGFKDSVSGDSGRSDMTSDDEGAPADELPAATPVHADLQARHVEESSKLTPAAQATPALPPRIRR